MKIINVMAVSVDGCIASSPGELDQDRKPFGFLTDADHKHVLEQLADADAVITGAESVRASAGGLIAKNAQGKLPIWVIFTNKGFDSGSGIIGQTNLPRWLVSKSVLDLPLQENLSNLVYGEKNPIQQVLSRLKAEKCKKVLLFGGGTINHMFYEQGLVNELILTICPVIFASQNPVPLVAHGLKQPVRLTLQTSHSSENLVFLQYTVNPIKS